MSKSNIEKIEEAVEILCEVIDADVKFMEEKVNKRRRRIRWKGKTAIETCLCHGCLRVTCPMRG